MTVQVGDQSGQLKNRAEEGGRSGQLAGPEHSEGQTSGLLTHRRWENTEDSPVSAKGLECL